MCVSTYELIPLLIHAKLLPGSPLGSRYACKFYHGRPNRSRRIRKHCVGMITWYVRHCECACSSLSCSSCRILKCHISFCFGSQKFDLRSTLSLPRYSTINILSLPLRTCYLLWCSPSHAYINWYRLAF